jgi:uncharacterized membrane protein
MPVVSVFSNKLLGSILAVWLGGSLLLDFVVMPVMYGSGMMGEAGFASVGYTLFRTFNQLEIICAALVMATVLVRRHDRQMEAHLSLGGLLLPLALLIVAMLYSYWLTPQMSAIGLNLDWFSPTEVPGMMNVLHLSYWTLEVVKLTVGFVLLNRCFRSAL